MAKTTSKDTRADDLASILKDTLNEKLGTKTVKAVYALDDDDNPANVDEFISTGCDALDLAISNRPNGGIPVGRITEITGLEQTGKTVLCASIIAQTQKKGGMGVFIDTENAVSKDFFQMLGVDISRDKFLYISVANIEDVFEAVSTILLKAIEQRTQKYITICVDSVAAATTRTEMESDYGKDGYATSKALIISKAMRKLTQLIGVGRIALIFTNQLRQILNAQAFAEQWAAPGGKAIPFHATVRLRLQNMGKLTTKIAGNDIVVGQKVQAKLVKNRVGPPHTKADYDFYFASGIDNFGSWFTILKKYNLLKASSSWYTIIDETTGEEHKFQSKDFNNLLKENPSLKAQCYQRMCDRLIVVYEKNDFGVDDVSTIPENDPSLDLPTEMKGSKAIKSDTKMLLTDSVDNKIKAPSPTPVDVIKQDFIDTISSNIGDVSSSANVDDDISVIDFDDLPDAVKMAVLEEM